MSPKRSLAAQPTARLEERRDAARTLSVRLKCLVSAGGVQGAVG